MKRRHIFLLCLALLLCCPLLLNAQSSQTNYQYWIDNNKDEAVYGTVNGEDISLSIDASALRTGVHYYNIRAYETVGSKTKWGTIYRYLFSIPSSANGVPNNLSRYEYWLDNDYEHRVTTTVNSEESEALLSIDVNSLTPGVHFYNFRAQDVDGIWGTIYRYLFSIPYPQQANGNRLIMGYSYAFNDGTVTSVVFDTPVEEYQLIKAFDIPQAQPPMVIDDDCSFVFDDEDNIATLSRNINMSFSLYFKDESDAIGSPVTTDFKVEDIQTQAIQIVSIPGSATIASHENGGFSVVCFEVPTDMELLIQTDATSSLRLYSPYSQLLDRYDATSLTTGVTREFEAGTYYAVVYGNTTDVTFSLSTNNHVVDNVTFTQSGNVLTLVTTTEGASIHYCVDGGEWLIYSIPLVMEGAHTVQAYAEKAGYTTSNTTSYQFNYVRPVVATPQITHEGNTITITTSTEGATIYYTIDGTTPTSESTVYSAPFTTTENGTIKAIAIKEGYENSTVKELIVNWIVVTTCGYAIYDQNQHSLSFYYGDKPADNRNNEGIWVYDADYTNFKSWACENPWFAPDITTVTFDPSFAKARPMTTAGWFYGCKNLTEIIGIEYLNTENVLDMSYMFYECCSLTSIDLSHFNTAKVGTGRDGLPTELRGSMAFMFAWCYSLTHIDISNFVINENLSHSLDMQHMFSLCGSLKTIDISGFKNISANMSGLFNGCSSVITIYVGEEWSNEYITGTKMFQGCNKLVGGKGTVYDQAYMDKTYARIDNAPSAPGYFTYKAPVQKGDANGDGTIDTQDAIKVVQYYLGKNPTDFNTEAADVNNDGVVDTQDAIQIIKIYLKKE